MEIVIVFYQIKTDLNQASHFQFATRENNYNLRNFQELESSLKRTVKFGTETISYRVPQIWNLIPERLRELETLNKFKKDIKKWKCNACPCKMC